MSQGFIKLNREKGMELLEEDPQAFQLLTLIALRARRTDAEYSRILLKSNQAFIGDYKKAGLTRQKYRNAKKRLTRYGLATFEPSNRGTIATLTSTEVYDINAEQNTSSNKPSNSPTKTVENEPTKNQPTTTQDPINNQLENIETPLTRMEECKKTTTASLQAEAVLYDCLQNHQALSLKEKQSLMVYLESRILLAIEWSTSATIKRSLIQALHWHCRQKEPPLPPKQSSSNHTAQQNAAWEYNQFLKNQGQTALSAKNNDAIPQHHAYLILNGETTTISLSNLVDTVKSDFRNSMNEILSKTLKESPSNTKGQKSYEK